MENTIVNYMDVMTEMGASDMYISVARPVMMRVQDHFAPAADTAMVMTSESIRDVIKEILSEKQLRDFDLHKEMNVAFGLPGKDRFRVNILQQRETPSLVIRAIKRNIPAFETLGLPENIKKLALQKRGIILLCGMTGSGKSTTLASMIDYRNATTQGHIITIEDPVEYVYEHKESIVTQREVGTDTDSYHVALKNAFRQKPDVILVGEIRDRYVMEQALVAAETGHLCLSTIHANNTYQAIERILNFFEDTQINQVRMNLAMNIRALISQRLIQGIDGKHILAFEIMLNEGYVKELILKGETNKIREVMAQNKTSGMVTFDQTLLRLYEEGRIEDKIAIAESDMPVDMELKIRKQSVAAQFNTQR